MPTRLTFVRSSLSLQPPHFFYHLAWIAALLFAQAASADDIAAQWRGVTRIHGTAFIESREWIDEEMDQVQSRDVAEVSFDMVVDRSTEMPHMTFRATSAMVAGPG